MGAGTGGFTRQVLDRLDRNATTELVRYTATDVTPSFRQALLAGLASPKLAFQVRSSGGCRAYKTLNSCLHCWHTSLCLHALNTYR